MAMFSTILGIGLIIFALLDLFREVIHPEKSGIVSSLLSGLLWRIAHGVAARRGAAVLSWAGPLAVVLSVAAWIALLIVGWAFLIWPHLPVLYVYGTGVPERGSFIEALYVSQVTLATLGYGDIVPEAGWLRFLVPLEAFIGFGILSAATSWILSLYPPLSRSRFAAHELELTRDAGAKLGLDLASMPPADLAHLLRHLTSKLVTVQSDLARFPVIYYFRPVSGRASVPEQLPYAFRLATSLAREGSPPAVRFQACRLRLVIEAICSTVASKLGGRHQGTEQTLQAYAKDHVSKDAGAHT